MKFLIASALVLASVGMASAEATMDKKGTNSQGSTIGVQSSQVTGNGDHVGGNGTGNGEFRDGDQTTTPGSRADAVHDAKSRAGEKGGHDHQR